MGTYCTCLALLLLLGTAKVHAQTTVFDFETDDQIAAWTIRAAAQDKLERSPQFATFGQSSMLFTTPAWKQGMGEWPAFEAKPPVADWRGYDRLMIDITNSGTERHFFSLFVSDSKLPFRDGLNYRFDLPAGGFKRFAIPLSFPEKVDRSDLSVMHFFTQRPEADMRLHLDNFALLKPGETLPDPPPAFVGQVANLSLAQVGSFDQLVSVCRENLLKLADTPELRRRADAQVAKLAAQVKAVRDAMGSTTLTLARLDELKAQLDRLPRNSARLESVFRLQKACAGVGLPTENALVGFATSMEKILPRDVPFTLTATKSVEVSLARNEKESFQVAVLPVEKDLKQVAVQVGDLKSADGKMFAAANIGCDVVGYVETKTRPPYNVSHVGWWPDPILDFLGPIDIAAGDLQTFWVRVRAPKGQAPGTYRGTLTVSAAGAKPMTFDLTVKVRTFTLPDCTPLPTAITFFEQKGQMGGEENWPTMKLKYADFLADYYIDYDSLYRSGPPDYEILQHLHDQGRLVAFNLGNVFNGGTDAEGFDKAIADTVERLRPAYERAKELGLLDHAYIYGFDERPKEQFGLLEKSAQALRKAFPEVLLMTTSYDDSFGLDSVVKTIDAWCPLTPKFDMAKAAKARAQGKAVWWYICCGPHNPYANWFVEYAAIESRLLMGAMPAKYQPDGFLYYLLTKWNQNKPVETGPFTDWNPVSWTVYHGDGSLFCSGPGGKPVPTIRLENYRDGQEDYAYACILEETIRLTEASLNERTKEQADWLEEATAALPVSDSLVKTMAEYSHDPQALYAWRNKVADLIDRSGMPNVDPWGKNFGVRGAAAMNR